MSRVLAIAGTGVTTVLLHPLRSAVTAVCVVAVLVPYLVALGISRGVEDEARAAAEYGGDLYVSGEEFGRPAPLPFAAQKAIGDVPGVTDVFPRIVGRIELGTERLSAVVVGVPLGRFPQGLECVEGRLYGEGKRNELVIGSELARRLDLKVGSLIPPFYRTREGERVSEVVGIFRSDVSLWQARLIVTSLATAAHIFDQSDRATDFVVTCRPGYQDDVRRELARGLKLTHDGPPLRVRVVTRDDLLVLLPRGPFHRKGIFTALFVLAFAVAILAVMVTSGFGQEERRREIGILKATGWQTDEVLQRSLTENFLIVIAGAALAVILAYVWLRGLNGYWIASIFLSGVDRMPAFRIPFRLAAVPALLAFLIALIVVMSGSLYSTWRTATAQPREVLR